MTLPSEARVAELARQLAAMGERETSGVYRRSFVSDRMMAWAMARPAFRAQLFRFVDAFPAMVDDDDIARHLQEYFSGDAPWLVEHGVDGLELGVPYSDPVMDGPVIQDATQAALERGFKLHDVFAAIRGIRAHGVTAPIWVMTYWNPVVQYGVDRFADDLAAAGGQGLITPDITPDSAADWIAASDRTGLDRVFLASPTSTDERLDLIVRSEASILLLAVDGDDGTILGTLTLVWFRIPTGVRAWIEDVVVDEAARGRGVGETLNLGALDRARALGARTVDLTSRPKREAANRLYKRIGFVPRDTNVYRFEV